MLVGRKKKTGLNQLQNHPIDLKPFGASPGSLLVYVLRRIPFGEHSSYLMAFSAVLDALKHHPEAKEILRTPPSELKTWDIRELFFTIEDVLAKRPEGSRYGRSVAVRALFARYDGKLKDGTRISDCKFRSRFPSDTATRAYKKTKNDTGTTAPPKLLYDFDSLQERNSKALGDAIEKQEVILEACEKVIAEHERAKLLVIAARNAGLPTLSKRTRNAVLRGGRPDRSIIYRMSVEDRLRLIVYMVDRVEIGNPVGQIPFMSLEQFAPLLDSDSGPKRLELLRSDRFLPRLVVVAHAIAILTITGLNPDVVYSLTRANITRQGNYVVIAGHKGRTDAIVEGHLIREEAANQNSDNIKVSHQSAIQALNELVANAEKIEAEFNLKAVPLICSLEYTTSSSSFYVFNFYQAATRFWKWNNLQHIELGSLRPLAARVEYLSPGGSLYSVQALLTHKDRTTTIEYVNSKIIMELYEANIRRFMRKLEATALFRLNRSGELAERGLSQKDIQLPLFPVTDALSARTLVDEWIFNEGEFKISLGIAEIAQCARQLKFYKLSYERLIAENPARFVDLHFPRMLFCAAVREVVKASAHWSIYRRIERELND